MNVKVSISAEDSNGNKVYLLCETGDSWNFYNKGLQRLAYSNFVENATELYIALDRIGAAKIPAIDILKSYTHLKNIK